MLLRVAEGDQPEYMTQELSSTFLTLRAHGLIVWDGDKYTITAYGHGYLDGWDVRHPEIIMEGGSNAA